MSLKTYTITATGQTSNGNVIAKPFSLEVHEVHYVKSDNVDLLTIHVCAKNGSGNNCPWDQLEGRGFNSGTKNYSPTPAMSSSKNSDFSATLEADLEAIVPGEWT